MKIKNFFIFSFILALSLELGFTPFSQNKSAKHLKRKKTTVVKKQIIFPQLCGNVFKLSGSQMPDPDQPTKKGAAFIGEILIYTITKQADTEGDGATLFTKINTKLVAKTNSDKSGHFCVNLPIGKYSIFVNVPGFGLFANNFDGEMNICPIEVVKGKNKDFEIQITSLASF